MTDYFATTGDDSFGATSGDDRYIYTDPNQINAGDIIVGQAGTDALHIGVAGVYNFTPMGGQFYSLERLSFFASGTTIFDAQQLDGSDGSLPLTLEVVGGASTSSNTIRVNQASSFTAAGWTFSTWDSNDLVRILGTGGADSITGSIQRDSIDGGSGRDLIDGGDGADTVFGGNLVGSVHTSDIADTLRGGNGLDLVVGDLYTPNDTVEHADTAAGFFDHDSLEGGDQGDTLYGDVNAMIGSYLTAGDDVLDGGIGHDRLVGDAHGFVIGASGQTAGGDDTIHGGDGDDTIFGDVETSDTGLGGNDVLYGDAGLDVIYGNSGDDLIDGGIGGDDLYGQSGNDTVTYAGSDVAVTVQLNTTLNSGGFAAGDSLHGFEGLIGSPYSDSLTGDAGDNFINGGNFNDTISGGAGNDLIIDGAFQAEQGRDSISGDAGNDTVKVFYWLSNEHFDGGADRDLLDLSGDATSNVVELALGSLSLLNGPIGGSSAQILNFEDVLAGSGDDVIVGTSDANWLRGGGGDDSISGGAGADNLNGGAGFDTVSYQNSDVGVSVNLNTSLNSGGDAEGDTLSGFEALFGSNFADGLVGSTASNDIRGGGGNDTIVDGQAGVANNHGIDSIDAGSGNDTIVSHYWTNGEIYNGGSGTDLINFGGDQSTYIYAIDLDAGTLSSPDRPGNHQATISNFEYAAGHQGADSITGTSGSNAITGLDGNDTILGLAGDDTILGDVGDDTIEGGGDNDSINGGSGNDSISGGSGNDWIRGDAGNDLIEGGAGADDLRGGGSSGAGDTVSYAGSTEGVHVIMNASTGNTGGDAEGDSLSGFRGFIGSDFNDTVLTGPGVGAPALADGIFSMGAGDDYLSLTENYTVETIYIDGGTGVDVLDLGALTISFNINLADGVWYDHNNSVILSIENIYTTTGNDSIVGSEADNHFSSSGGNNRLAGGGGNDHLQSGSGADILRGQVGHDTLDGGDGNDTLFGGWGNDVMAGGGDNDRLWGEFGDDSMQGGAGDDTLGSSNGNDTMSGQAGNDLLIGAGGDDRMWAGDGDDTMNGGIGADEFHGGAGRDLADYSWFDTGARIDMLWAANNAGAAVGDVLDSIEDVVATAQDDTVNGTNGANRIDGLNGADVLSGRGGDDMLIGGGGNDTLFGGWGNDVMAGGGGNDRLWGEAGDDNMAGDAGHDTLGGAAGNDTLIGNFGNDLLIGEGGDDRMWAGDGDDTMNGGIGADEFHGGNGRDLADYSWFDTGAQIDMLWAANNAGAAVGDVLDSIEDVVATAQDDTVNGTNGANWIDGLNGADVLSGRGGDDMLVGGGGNDTLIGNDGNDTLTGNSGSDALFGGTGNDNMFGGDGDDTLSGGAGNDVANGGGGADVINTGMGDDTAAGGAGTDTFVFNVGDGHLRVTDFADNVDTLDIDLAGFGFADAAALINSASVFVNAWGSTVMNLSASDQIILVGVGDKGVLLDDIV